jgi:predicted dehydrogenase
MAIRTVIIGMGPRGCDWAREIKKNKQFELVAAVDVDQAVLDSAADSMHLNGLKCFCDLNQALSTMDLDAAIIATPADAHFDPCELALSRGISLLVEKPFTTTLAEAAKLVTLATQNAVPLVVAQNYRYMRAFRAARQVIQAGRLGPIGAAVCQYYRIPHEMSPALARTPHSVLWGVGVHHLDMLRYVFKKRFTGVLADSFKSSWGELPEGASMRLLLTLEDGARIFYGSTYESSGHDFFERGQEFYARFVGQHATLHILHRWLVLC